MSAVLSPTETLDALVGIVQAIEATPPKGICPEDGCLLIGTGPCPACEVRNGPRLCECGRRLKHPEASQCWVCLRLARIAARRFCECGSEIRTEHDKCTRCRRRVGRYTEYSPDEDRPFRWVQRGGVWRPVFEQSEVA